MNYIYKISFFILLAVVSACNKQLNVLPTTSRVDGNAITDLKSAQTVLNGVYYRFANADFDYNEVPVIKWYSVQHDIPSSLSGLMVIPGGGDNFAEHTYTPADYRVDQIWKYGYNIVNAANGFLENIEPVSLETSVKQEMIAEAKFLRAFANTMLLLYYGEYADQSSNYGIILRDKAVQPGSINQPRTTVAQSYTSILADLDDAITHLPEEASEKYYTNKYAAMQLKARLLINRGAAGDYAEVLSLTNDLINASPFSLEPVLRDIFQRNGLNSPEVIMGVQPYPSQAEVFQNYHYYHQEVTSDFFVDLLTDDPRNEWMYKMAMDDWYGDVPAFCKYYTGDPNNIASDGFSEIGYAFRLTEAYLLRAEALTLSEGDLDEAKSLLKTVMTNAGITDFSEVDAATDTETLHLLIVKETMKNFIGESGLDWFAVRRLPFATVQGMLPTLVSPIQMILPVPLDEINENKEAKQTPGY